MATSTTERRRLKPAEQQAAIDAAELLLFADGVDDAGQPVELARRSRVVARELQLALRDLDQERSARRALKERCDTLQAIIGRAAYHAAVEATT